MSAYIDNQTQREEQLKEIIRQLHAGRTVDEVRAAFADLLEDVGPDEIVRIEEALVTEGLDPAEIQPLCDVHVAVFKASLDQQQTPETIPGHPVFTYRAENLGVQRVLDQIEAALAALEAAIEAGEVDHEVSADARERALAGADKLRTYDRHYLRLENLLFPYLERTGFSGPSKVMWGVHDEIRAMWKRLQARLAQPDEEHLSAWLAETQELFATLNMAIREMIYKESHILFPAALERLNDADWASVRDQGEEIGYAYARPGRAWVPGMAADDAETGKAAAHGGAGAERAAAKAPEGGIPLDVGVLSAAQINMMLQALPIDVTFVDEHDTVRYFSQSRERIFQRSPAIIGRKVQNCHPPQSVDKVQAILDDFRAGKREVAEFWIQMQGMFVHIRYFPLYDEAGDYRGTIEVTQNLKPLRALEGEKRLLDA
jgi:hypothetical protein